MTSMQQRLSAFTSASDTLCPPGTQHCPPPAPRRGTDGDDTLQGIAGNDYIEGAAGNDVIHDTKGNNLLMGGAGDDTIVGCGVISGESGNDNIVASGDHANNTMYLYDEGDGLDTLFLNHGDTGSSSGSLLFGQGIEPQRVALIRENDDLLFSLDMRNQVRVADWFKGPSYQLDEVTFDNAIAWSNAVIASMDTAIIGTTLADHLTGGPENNLIHAGDGNDTVLDYEGSNLIHGGNGDDILMGRGTLDGGHGDDTLLAVGDAIDNVYFFDEGDGHDILHANSGRSFAPQGAIGLGESLNPDHIWLQRKGNDLDLILTGSKEGITIKDWYLGEQHQVRVFMAGNDQVLDNERVDALVQAMAPFLPPANHDCSSPAIMPLALQPALATAWV